MLRKLCCLGLIMVFLFSASALAEYDQYRLTVGDKLENLQKWEIFPLDAHNVIVRVYNPLPWHVSWYRDGKLLRTLVPEGDYDSVTPVEPVFEGDGSFSMLCRIPSEEQSTDKFPPPNAQAEWTEEGLTRITPLKERVYATRWDNRIVFYRTDEYARIRYNGKDTCISRELADILRNGSCIALADEVFLTRYFNLEEEDTAVLCLDHGNIRYRIEDPLWCDRFLPDGQGGFFTSQWDIAEWTLERDYSPVRLTHYDRDGKCDRVYQMKGDRVSGISIRIITDVKRIFTWLRTVHPGYSCITGSIRIQSVRRWFLSSCWTAAGTITDFRSTDDPVCRKVESRWCFLWKSADPLVLFALKCRSGKDTISVSTGTERRGWH